MNINYNQPDDQIEPDYDSAHYVAFDKMPEENRSTGELNCCDYLIEYHRELGEDPMITSPDLLNALEAMTTIRSELAEMDLLAQTFERRHLKIPVGLYDLPLLWGRAIREMILETLSQS
jgi:hypothetical protein